MGEPKNLVATGAELLSLLTTGRWMGLYMTARYTEGEAQAPGEGAVAKCWRESGS